MGMLESASVVDSPRLVKDVLASVDRRTSVIYLDAAPRQAFRGKRTGRARAYDQDIESIHASSMIVGACRHRQEGEVSHKLTRINTDHKAAGLLSLYVRRSLLFCNQFCSALFLLICVHLR